MQKSLALCLFLLSAAVTCSNAAIVWMCGMDDNGWPVGDGGGPNTSFLQENAVANALPGSPVTASETNFGADNDYYFAGLYDTVIAGNGFYTPVGVVAANEEGAERAFSAQDNDLRFHFNLPATLQPNDLLSITFDPFNLDTTGGSDPRYGVELYFNGVLVMPQVIVRAGQLDTDIKSLQFTAGSVDARTGPGADNIVSLRGINYNGDQGGNWMGIDYVQLDSVPEPTSGVVFLFSAVALTTFLCRSRRFSPSITRG